MSFFLFSNKTQKIPSLIFVLSIVCSTATLAKDVVITDEVINDFLLTTNDKSKINTSKLPRPEQEKSLMTLLPDAAQTRLSLDQHPYVLLAKQDQITEASNGIISSKGTNPWLLRAGVVKRRIPSEQMNSTEPNIGIEKTLRWAGKVKLEKQLGGLQRESGELIIGDAWHESAKQLHERWFDFIRALNEVELMQAYLALLQQQINVTQKRIDAGELPKLDRLLIQTEFFNEQARLIGLQNLAYEKGLALKQIYSGSLPQSLNMQAALPTLLKLNADIRPFLNHPKWAEESIEHNHELELAINLAEQANKKYDIIRKQVLGDPTVGTGYFNEMNHQEKLYAVNISVPFGVPSRQAQIIAAKSIYDRAMVHVSMTKNNLLLLLKQDINRLTNAGTQLQYASDQLQQFKIQNQTMHKAYALGEIDMSMLILNQKQNKDVQQRLTNAEIDFLSDLTLLYINTHQLWSHDEQESLNKNTL